MVRRKQTMTKGLGGVVRDRDTGHSVEGTGKTTYCKGRSKDVGGGFQVSG